MDRMNSKEMAIHMISYPTVNLTMTVSAIIIILKATDRVVVESAVAWLA